MRLPRLAFAPPHHARAQSSAAGRVLVRKPDGSLAYLPRRSLDFSAGFFPEPASPADVVAARTADAVIPASEPVAPSVDPPSPAELREVAAEPPSGVSTSRPAMAKVVPRIVRGVEIPARPPAPESDECCMSGCARCVYDLYGTSALPRATLTSTSGEPARLSRRARHGPQRADRQASACHCRRVAGRAGRSAAGEQRRRCSAGRESGRKGASRTGARAAHRRPGSVDAGTFV